MNLLKETRCASLIEILLTNPLAYTRIELMTPDDLKKWREKNGYTQASLAKALAVIPITVSRWERGVREIPSFLHLALETLERKGGEKGLRGRKTKKKGGKDHG
ncbi:MAG: helix-turn-helix protein [Syntrophorhabdaceae bacterium PtaU1.Bin034]|nr:MAG: helix-turn-helix protein [Syntrophorhabdaceae bacterium PtaU1.Bin034]